MKLTPRGDYFDGLFHSTEKATDESIEKICPADLENHLWNVGVDYSNVDKAIHSAEVGFESFRKMTFEQRIELLNRFREAAVKKKDQIALAIALETGKPLWESLTEAGAIAAKVDVTINESLKRIKKRTIENVLPSIAGHTLYKPLGVCLVVGPFNFPCHLANGQILSALLAGNSIIFKPSEKTICSSQMLIECFHEAGFPKGVINFINGTATTTQNILKHPSVKGIYFTGSYAVGKKILESVGTDITKLVALELGGKNTTILHKDTPIDHALPELLRSCFLSSGQRCTSTSMIAIHRDIEQEFIDKFSKLAQRMIVDHPVEFSKKPFMGPLVDDMALTKYNDAINIGLDNGAEEIFRGTNITSKYNGHYAAPTIHYLKTAAKQNPFTQNEIFGPQCTFTSYTNIEDAINIANISDYGLAASIFTKDSAIYSQVLRDVDAGIINLNRSTVGASSKLPFGGVKNSGNHHPAAVSMIDHTVSTVASLETMDCSSQIDTIVGLD